MRRVAEVWSPDWLTHSICQAEDGLLQRCVQLCERFVVVRIMIAVAAMYGGWVLANGWPQFRTDIGYEFFRGLGPSMKTGYLLTGALGVFMICGAVRVLLPRLFSGWPFDLVAFCLAGWILWDHAVRYSFFVTPLTAIVIQVMVTILPFFMLLFWLKRDAKSVFMFFMFSLTVLLALYYFMESFWQDSDMMLLRNPWLTALALSLGWSAVIGFFWTAMPKTELRVVVITVIVSLGSTVILWFMGNKDYARFNYAYFSPGRYWMPFVLLLLTLSLPSAKMSWVQQLRQVFFPGHWLGQVPYFREQIETNDRRVEAFIRGIWDLLKIVFVLVAIDVWGSYFPLDRAKIPVFGLIVYVSLFLLSWLTFLIPVAAARLMGFMVPDPFELPLLAANPMDRWRRWNTYYFEWFRVVIFTPILKATRSPGAAVALVFLTTWFVHVCTIAIGYHPNSRLEVVRILFDKGLFFGLHGAAVYLGLKLPKLFPAGTLRKGWLGVLLVVLIMTLIHHFAYPNVVWQQTGVLQQYRDLLIGF